MSDAWKDKSLGVIGGGNMAEALIRGVVEAGLLPAGRIAVFDPVEARRQVFAGLGCVASAGPEVPAGADAVLLATKPQVLPDAVRGLSFAPDGGQLLISIAAGIPTAAIEKLLPPRSRVVRVMPNTPLLVGMGTSALAKGSHAADEDLAQARELFACGGRAVVVEERLLDAVTALSGSGPAYLFRFAEALMAGGAALGLPADLARELTIGTLRGSAEMLSRDPDAATLRERVTSPGGTTAAALAVFQDGDFMGLVAAALAAAERRGRELGGS